MAESGKNCAGWGGRLGSEKPRPPGPNLAGPLLMARVLKPCLISDQQRSFSSSSADSPDKFQKPLKGQLKPIQDLGKEPRSEGRLLAPPCFTAQKASTALSSERWTRGPGPTRTWLPSELLVWDAPDPPGQGPDPTVPLLYSYCSDVHHRSAG